MVCRWYVGAGSMCVSTCCALEHHEPCTDGCGRRFLRSVGRHCVSPSPPGCSETGRLLSMFDVGPPTCHSWLRPFGCEQACGISGKLLWPTACRVSWLDVGRAQEHVSEYGVHWNFFFTLALVTVLSEGLDLAARASGGSLSSVAYLLLGAVLGCGESALQQAACGFALTCTERPGYQIALNQGLQGYILSSPRESLFSKNREGLLGAFGMGSVLVCTAVPR